MKSMFLSEDNENNLTAKEKVLYALTAFFFITLYLPSMPVINNVFIGLIFIYSFFFNTIREKLDLLKQRKEVIAMIIFYLIHVISFFFSVNKVEAGRMLGMRVPLFMFPVAIGLIYIREPLKERILLIYAGTTTLAAFICLFFAWLAYNHTGNSGLLYNDSLTMPIGKQSIYFALMVDLALFSYVYLLEKKSLVIRFRWLMYLAMIFLVIMNFMLASRIAIIDLYLSLLVLAVFYMIKKRKLLEGMTLVMGLLVGSFLLVKFLPKTLNRFKEFTYTDYQFNNHGIESHYNMELTKDQWNGINIRLAVWSCGWELAKQNPFLGAGLGDKKDKMMGIYKKRKFDFAYKSERNMHNNYLDVLCTFGIVGSVIFLLGFFIFPVVSSFRVKDLLGMAVVVAFAFSLSSETYLDRSLGCVLTAFFLNFIAGYKNHLNR